MKIITINVPAPFVRIMQEIIDAGMFPSRSELIRVAIRDFCKNEIEILQKFGIGNHVKATAEDLIIPDPADVALDMRRFTFKR